MNKSNRSTLVLLAIFLVVWVAAGPAIGFVVDALWFDSMGYWDIFVTPVGPQAGVWAAVVVLSLPLLGINGRPARPAAGRQGGRGPRAAPEDARHGSRR